jgi:hypothetical protein
MLELDLQLIQGVFSKAKEFKNENKNFSSIIIASEFIKRKMRVINSSFLKKNQDIFLDLLDKKDLNSLKDIDLSEFQKMSQNYEFEVNDLCEISNYQTPPKSIFILVKAIKDAGVLLTSKGYLNISKGCIMSVVLEDVKELLERGVLTQILC